MKGFGKKIIFGIALIVCIDTALLFLFYVEDTEALWMPKLFLFAFQGGIVLWLVLNAREAKKRKQENFRRKNQ